VRHYDPVATCRPTVNAGPEAKVPALRRRGDYPLLKERQWFISGTSRQQPQVDHDD
jgi:hypothetical protein